MTKIYRFRKCEDKLIDYVLNKRIEGSKYSTMIAGDPKEVSITADTDELMTVTQLPREIVNQGCNIIRENILKAYYLSCFSTVNQIEKLDMWKEYAGMDGFCLVYDDEKINEAVIDVLRNKKDRTVIFRNVDYGNNPVDITSFIKDFLLLIGDNINDEEAYIRAANEVGKRHSLEERRRIIGAMFHKIGEFPEKAEKRMAVLLDENDSKYCEDMLGVDVIPEEIICSSLMKRVYRRRLERFAKKKGIIFSIKDIIDIEENITGKNERIINTSYGKKEM